MPDLDFFLDRFLVIIVDFTVTLFVTLYPLYVAVIVYFLGLSLILNKAYPFLFVLTLYDLPFILIFTTTPAPTAFPLSPYALTL